MLYIETDTRKYDLRKHQYYINNQYMVDNFGVSMTEMSSVREDINPQMAADRFLRMLCSQLYYYVFEYAENRLLMEYLIATNYNDFADIMEEAMGLYCYTIYLSGNAPQFDTFLTLDNGKEIDKKDVSIQMVPIAVRNVLETGDLLCRSTRTGFDLRTIRQLKAQGEF